jgi:cobalt/nickel transport system permease protein
MHIPDGFLSTLMAVILWVVSAISVAYALRRVDKDLGERQVPLMGVLAAAIWPWAPTCSTWPSSA